MKNLFAGWQFLTPHGKTKTKTGFRHATHEDRWGKTKIPQVRVKGCGLLNLLAGLKFPLQPVQRIGQNQDPVSKRQSCGLLSLLAGERVFWLLGASLKMAWTRMQQQIVKKTWFPQVRRRTCVSTTPLQVFGLSAS